jgi:predicted kinase
VLLYGKITLQNRQTSGELTVECVMLIGIQASGKSSFYKERFFKTHVRINLDMLKTRQKEDIFLAASFEAKQKFVVDNTNPSRLDRRKYIEWSKTFHFKVLGYFWEPDLEHCLLRNQSRQGKERIPATAIRSTLQKLEEPAYDEGFDRLYLVKLIENIYVVTEIDR